MTTRSNLESHWDEFCDWCEESGRGDPRSNSRAQVCNWEPWFECWNAALDAREADEADAERVG